MKKLFIILFVFMGCNAIAQDHQYKLASYKFYDTTKNYDGIKDKHLTINTDSTGISLYAWGEDCYLKINLLQKMLINADYYKTGELNGHPYTLYGNNDIRFLIYINEYGDFEFDIQIFNKLANGKHEFSFDIESKGLEINYQPKLRQIEIDLGAFRPDTIIGTYAIKRLDGKKNNRNMPDGSRENYRTGKMGHFYKPKAWDNADDTVWGYIYIDTDSMIIGVDSAWLANATLPVTIDPTFGDTGEGGTNQGISANYVNISQYTSGADAGSATINSISMFIDEDGSSSNIGGALYADDGSDGCGNFVDSTLNNSTATDASTVKWYTMTMSAENTLSASTKYWLGLLTDAILNHRYDAGSGLWERHFNKPWPPDSPCGSHTWIDSDRDYSIYITYTVAGGPSPVGQVITIMGSIDNYDRNKFGYLGRYYAE